MSAFDWLRRSPKEPSHIKVNGRKLKVEIRRLSRARHITLRLIADGSVRITMPPWGREVDALGFARTRTGWLAEQLAQQPQPEALRPGAMIAWRGVEHRLDHHPSWPRRPVLADGSLRCGGPLESLDARLRRWLQSEAKLMFVADLADYTTRAGVPLPAMALSNARTRWGSCSTRGIVRLNWRLVMAPDAVRRSVVSHEVAHLVHFDHSERFHALHQTIYEGDLDAANRWLKDKGRSLSTLLG